MERKFTYGIYWYNQHLPLISFKAHNMKEADKMAWEILKNWNYEGTFFIEKLDGNKCKRWVIHYGEYKAEDYERDPWYISKIRRKIK